MLGFVISLSGLLVVNAMAYTSTSTSSFSSIYSSYYYSYYTTTVAITTTTTTADNAVLYSGLHIPMLVLGPVGGAVCIVFIVTINCLLKGACCNKNQQVSNYNLST